MRQNVKGPLPCDFLVSFSFRRNTLTPLLRRYCVLYTKTLSDERKTLRMLKDKMSLVWDAFIQSVMSSSFFLYCERVYTSCKRLILTFHDFFFVILEVIFPTNRLFDIHNTRKSRYCTSDAIHLVQIFAILPNTAYTTYTSAKNTCYRISNDNEGLFVRQYINATPKHIFVCYY